MGRGWDGELPAHPGSPPGPLPSLGQQPSSSPRAWGGVFLLVFYGQEMWQLMIRGLSSKVKEV